MLQTDLFNQPPIEVHSGESDKEVNEFYQENKLHFNQQLKKVYDILMTGEHLTQLSAIQNHGIYSLSTRISELEANNFPATKDWIYETNPNWITTKRRSRRKYFYTPEQIETYKIRYSIQVK
ncbi:MAG: helix-turn-helix domain-containing protein [Bacteroidota bacterium]